MGRIYIYSWVIIQLKIHRLCFLIKLVKQVTSYAPSIIRIGQLMAAGRRAAISRFLGLRTSTSSCLVPHYLLRIYCRCPPIQHIRLLHYLKFLGSKNPLLFLEYEGASRGVWLIRMLTMLGSRSERPELSHRSSHLRICSKLWVHSLACLLQNFVWPQLLNLFRVGFISSLPWLSTFWIRGSFCARIGDLLG